MAAVLDLNTFRNETVEKTVDMYHIPAIAPYTQDHVEINKRFFWNANLKPEWFQLQHLGLDYDDTRLREEWELEEIETKGDLQEQRFSQNAAINAMKSSAANEGKDIRCKGVFVVKDRSTGEAVLEYMQDGNTWYAVGKELDFPNYICIEFWTNQNWTPTNAIAIGVYLNLLEKANGPATEEDIENALRKISESAEFVKLMKDVDKNIVAISEKLLNYYGCMNGIHLKGNDASATIYKIINNIIFANDPVKSQTSNPNTEDVLKQLVSQGYTDNSIISFSALAYNPESLLTQHLLKRTKELFSSTTRIGVAIYKSGSISHKKYWWIKEAKKMIDKIYEYVELHEGSRVLEKFDLVGIYQNHVATDHKFKLGTVVTVEDILNWHKKLVEDGEI